MLTRDLSIADLYLGSARRRPERLFLHQLLADGGERRSSYREAARSIAYYLTALRERGLSHGDRIISYADRMAPMIYLHLACAHSGIISVPIAPSFSVSSVEDALERTGARAIFALPEQAKELEARGHRPLVAPVGPEPASPELGDPERALLLLEESARGVKPDDVYMFQPTSGTTGKSKFVVRSHRAFVRAGVVGALDFDAADEPQHRFLMVAALTHGMGQYDLACVLYLNAGMCVPTRIGMETSLAELHRLDPTYMTVPPRVLRALHRQHLERGDPSLRVLGESTRILSVGGAAAEPEILEHIRAQGVDIIDGYGASECSLLSFSVRGQWRAGSTGRVLPDVELRFDDDGEILAKTPVFMKGYFGDEALTRAAFTADGYYRTGDYGRVEDGELYYLGRKKDLFNTSEGTNIHPTRIEGLLEALPGVAQAILAGDGKPYISALLSLSPGGPPSNEPDGWLDPRLHPEVYGAIASALEPMNATLEAFEHVRKVALFTRAFPTEVYQHVAHAKTRRDRAAIARIFGERIARLYA